MNMRTWLCLLGLAASTAATADRFVVDATNPGLIADGGRDLQFDLSAIPGTIVSAQLVMDIHYNNARELGIEFVDGSGFVMLPVVPQSESMPVGKVLSGRYRVTDDAVTTWLLASAGATTIPASFPVRAWQPGAGGECRNLIGRFLEFDINRSLPLTLKVTRAMSPMPGTGRIDAAQLIIDTGVPDEIMATGFDEPDLPMGRCRPPQLNVVLNGQVESPVRSNFTVVHSTGGDQPLNWYFRDFVNPDVGPIAFGQGNNPVYVGRFGGRNRMNIGFWDAATGAVNFTTGAGARFVSLPPPAGNSWPDLAHQVAPGDYDGDGVTDVAIAYFDTQLNLWVARIRFSRSGDVRSAVVDPRFYQPAMFQSTRIGFGAGQDADRNGVDEFTLYTETSAGAMALVQLVFEGQTVIDGFSSRWGQLGDRMVLGKWTSNSSGNQFGLVVARPATAQTPVQWFTFPSITPQLWGAPADLPVSIKFDDDAINEVAVYRPSDRRLHVIGSETGGQFVLDPLGGLGGFNTPLGTLQGTTAPVEQ